MQSAKNRLEMAVSPQAKQTPPPEQPATDHSTHQAESTQEQNPCKTQDNWQLLASCPQNKTDSGTGDLSAWNDPEGQSSLCANPPRFRSHQGAGRKWSDSRQTTWEQAEKYGGGAGQGEHRSPAVPTQSTDSQRSKHRVRAHKNAKKPSAPSLCSFLQSMGLRVPCRLEETSHHTLPSPTARQCLLGANSMSLGRRGQQAQASLAQVWCTLGGQHGTCCLLEVQKLL